MKLTPHRFFDNFTDLLLDAICIVDAEGDFLYVSAAVETIFGYRPDEMIGRNIVNFIHPGDRQKTLTAVDEIMAGDLKPHFENRYVRKDGSTAHIMWSARWSEADQCRIAVARDITLRKRAESRQAAIYAISEAANIIEDIEGLFQRIHYLVADLLYARNFVAAVFDSDQKKLIFPYQAYSCPSSSHAEVLIGQVLSEQVIALGQSLMATSQALSVAFEGLNRQAMANWLAVPISANGNVIGALLVLSSDDHPPFSEEDCELLQFIAVQVAAAMERKQAVFALERMAQYDQLTDLPNRALFLQRLTRALQQAQRQQTRLAVLYLDLDKFKQVNDTYGHSVGDQLLQQVALRLVECVRQTDTVARLSGDEFVVLLENVQQSEDAERVAENIYQAFATTYPLSTASVRITPSIGIAFYPEDGPTEFALLDVADNAMYSKKREKQALRRSLKHQDA
jgi:diguanylate cyclase (GGDEF)-like protein/PAS domain S-box-containing protein